MHQVLHSGKDPEVDRLYRGNRQQLVADGGVMTGSLMRPQRSQTAFQKTKRASLWTNGSKILGSVLEFQA